MYVRFPMGKLTLHEMNAINLNFLSLSLCIHVKIIIILTKLDVIKKIEIWNKVNKIIEYCVSIGNTVIEFDSCDNYR